VNEAKGGKGDETSDEAVQAALTARELSDSTATTREDLSRQRETNEGNDAKLREWKRKRRKRH
jgi:hypothetical protein